MTWEYQLSNGKQDDAKKEGPKKVNRSLWNKASTKIKAKALLTLKNHLILSIHQVTQANSSHRLITWSICMFTMLLDDNSRAEQRLFINKEGVLSYQLPRPFLHSIKSIPKPSTYLLNKAPKLTEQSLTYQQIIQSVNHTCIPWKKSTHCREKII